MQDNTLNKTVGQVMPSCSTAVIIVCVKQSKAEERGGEQRGEEQRGGEQRGSEQSRAEPQ